ncbi:MAG TPA: heme NO-binding domain-containing protein [Actinomycetota bacterium]
MTRHRFAGAILGEGTAALEAHMKGVIFDLLEQVVSKGYGEQTWETMLDQTGLDGAYTAVGSYPDEQLGALVVAGATLAKVEPDALVRWFGKECVPLLVERYPEFFAPHTETKSFLLTLNEVIHPEVRKLFPGAYAPSFEFDAPSDDTLALTYSSHRKLCSFAEGLIEGAAEHFKESVRVTQSLCSKRGDDQCRLLVTFEGSG